MWLPWPYAVVGAVMLITAALVFKPRGRLWTQSRPFALEISLILVLYSLWRIAGQLSVFDTTGAQARATQIWDLERTLHLPSELAIQRAVLPHPWMVQAANGYYAIVHVPALIAMLIWLFVRHRDRYPAVRNTLALLTGACLLIQLVPVMPPRFMSSLGFVDTGHLYGQSVYTALGRGASDQLSAMPSLHVGWALLVGITVVVASTSRWRWLVLAHPILTVSVVVVTANHWWMYGIVAAAILVVSYGLDRLARRLLARTRWGDGSGHADGPAGPDQADVTDDSGPPAATREPGPVPVGLPVELTEPTEPTTVTAEPAPIVQPVRGATPMAPLG